jgi:hypothetical protein
MLHRIENAEMLLDCASIAALFLPSRFKLLFYLAGGPGR